MRPLNRLLLMLVALFLPLCAQGSTSGTAAFSVLQIDNNARTIAMGGASVAMPNDLYGAWMNPASAAFITRPQAMAGYQSWIADAWIGPAGYAMPYKNNGVFGANIVYIDEGSVDGVDENNLATGATWHVFSLMAGLSWAKIIYDNLGVGIDLKGLHEAISSTRQDYYSQDGVALDAGIQYRMLKSRLILGGSIRNAGFLLKSYSTDGANLPLPLEIRAGASYVPVNMPTLRFALDLQQANNDALNYKPGVEWTVVKNTFFVRAGWGFSEQDLEHGLRMLQGNSSSDYVMTSANGLALGFGIHADISGLPTNVDLSYLASLNPTFGLTLLFDL